MPSLGDSGENCYFYLGDCPPSVAVNGFADAIFLYFIQHIFEL